MNVYYKIVENYGAGDETHLVPEHMVKQITHKIIDGEHATRLYLVGGGCYTVYAPLENFIDSNRVEL